MTGLTKSVFDLILFVFVFRYYSLQNNC